MGVKYAARPLGSGRGCMIAIVVLILTAVLGASCLPYT